MLCLLLSLLTHLSPAYAGELGLPDSLAASALSETRPGARTPFDLKPETYTFRWTNAALDDVTLTLQPDSVDWVRTSEVLVVPTARLEVVGQNISAGTVQASGFQQAMTIEGSQGRVEIPIALLTGAYNPIRVSIVRDGVPLSGTATLRHETKGAPLIARDTSCSKHWLTWTTTGDFAGDWIFLGCREAQVRGEGGRTSSLEIYALWDGPAGLTTAGVTSGPTLTNTWTYRLRHTPGTLTLTDEDRDELKLSYRIRKRSHNGVMGLTLGPAISPTADGALTASGFLRPHLILRVDERSRAVFFDALFVNEEGWINDIGGYYGSPLLSLADDRIRVSSLLGAHLQTYAVEDKTVVRYSFPQGIDIHIPDAVLPSWWLRAGGFIQPKVGQSAYYQAYVRYGPMSYLEVNYTSWQHRDREHQRVSLLFGGQLLPLL
jgi:hypothetical protein